MDRRRPELYGGGHHDDGQDRDLHGRHEGLDGPRDRDAADDDQRDEQQPAQGNQGDGDLVVDHLGADQEEGGIARRNGRRNHEQR